MIDFTVIATGSTGNAVLIGNEIMVDCGVPFRALRPHYKTLKLVLLTHCHGDHISPATVRKLAQERPTLRFGCCEWMTEQLVGECGVNKRNIDIYPLGSEIKYSGFATIRADATTHNVPNCAYHIQIGEDKVFYATDTNSLHSITAKDYDLYLVEGNYNEQEIRARIEAKQAAGEYCHEWDVLKNHLSEQKALDFIYSNIGASGRYALLHRHQEE